MKIEGKVALITGGARGIGKAYCEALLEKEAKGVAILDVKVEVGKETASQLCTRFGTGRATFIRTDVTNESELKAAFQRTLEVFGRLDIVSCTAGIVDEIDYKRMIDINLTSVITGTQLAFDYMREHGGVVVNTASVVGLCSALPSVSAYSATKFGVVGFTQSICQTYSMPGVPGYGIRVNAVCPNLVNTALPHEVKTKAHFEDMLKQTNQNAKWLTPADVAVAFIRLVENDNLNGVCVRVEVNGQINHHPTFC